MVPLKFDLTGRVAVVTGGNRGIGLGISRGLAKAGAKLAIWSRDVERNTHALADLKALGAEAIAVSCDVSDETSVAAALAETLAVFGQVDMLFANAGTSSSVVFPEVSLPEWDQVLATNLTGSFLAARAVTAHLIERGVGGVIVFTASVVAHAGLPLAPHYTASKGGLVALAKSLAVRLARYQIRVNVLSPGWVISEMTDSLQADPKFEQVFIKRTPLRRWGTPEDFEGPAVFLAADASAFMTGAELIVDGGFTAA